MAAKICPGKLFIGGMNPSTTEETVGNYFAQWGDVTRVVITLDRNTGLSRGFGFVTFANRDSLDPCLQAGPHVLDGKTLTVDRSQPRNFDGSTPEYRTAEVFVGGLPGSIQEDEIAGYFGQWGPIAHIRVKRDHDTGRARGFAFVIYEHSDYADFLMEEHPAEHEVFGRTLTVGRAKQRDAFDGAGGPPGDAYGGRPTYGGPRPGPPPSRYDDYPPRGAAAGGRGRGRGRGGYGTSYDNGYAAEPPSRGRGGYSSAPRGGAPRGARGGRGGATVHYETTYVSSAPAPRERRDPYAAPRRDSYAAPPPRSDRADPYARANAAPATSYSRPPPRSGPYAAPPRADPYAAPPRADPYAAPPPRSDPYAAPPPRAEPYGAPPAPAGASAAPDPYAYPPPHSNGESQARPVRSAGGDRATNRYQPY